MSASRDEQQGPRYRLLLFTGYFVPGTKAGGPIRSVVEILERLAPDVEATVVTSDRDLGDTAPYPGLSGRLVPYGRHRVFYWDRRSPRHLVRLLGVFRSAIFDVMYTNSFWSPFFSMGPAILRSLRVIRSLQVMIAPRGELGGGALSLKSRKKRVALQLWEPILRRAGVTFHASTEAEAQEVKRAVPGCRVFVQINTRGSEPVVDFETPEQVPRLVFLGRISPKKNLSTAIHALVTSQAPAIFDIYGPIEDEAYWEECQKLLRGASSQLEVNYRGAVAHEEVQATFARYDAFLFPTLGENFGHVIVESLSAACPVICSPHTPWTQVLQNGGGVVVDSGELTEWTRAVTQFCALPPQERLAARHTALVAYKAWRARPTDELAVEQLLRRTCTAR